MLAYVRLSNQRDPGKGTECTVYEPTGEKHTFVYPSGSLSHVSFLNISRDGRFVAALGNDVSHRQDTPAARLLVWNVDSQELVLNQLQPRELNRMEFSPDGSMVIEPAGASIAVLFSSGNSSAATAPDRLLPSING